MTLEPDGDQLEIFLDAVLRHRGDEGYLSLRAFFHSNKPLHSNLWTVRLGPRTGSRHVLDIAVDLARRAANTPEPAVFCPPLAVFNNSDGFKAREEDLLKGLAISVECDQHPEEARQKLQDVLCQGTAIVRSGGKWVNGDGEPEDKLHLHWRLRTPATGVDLVKLKQARRLAADLVGGDASSVPAVHCLRWPGSWHRKAEPRLCELIACNPDIEIDLDEALAALEAAALARGPGARNGQSGGSADEAALIANIRNGLNLHDSINRLAAKYIAQGSTINDAIARLQAYMNDSKARLERTKEWQARDDDITRSVESAYLKFRRGEPEPTPEGGDPGDQPASGYTRPTIRIVAGQLPNAVAQSEQALIDAGFQIFVRGSQLMHLVTQILPASDGRTTEVAKLREIVPDLLLRWLAEAAAYIKFDARSKAWVKCDPPRQLATTLLASADRWPFAAIAGVIASPTLRPDGSLLIETGYDAATQLYLAVDPTLRMPPLDLAPTQAQAEAALRLLKDLLSEFKFANPTDKSVALSLFLTLAARSAMPVAPLHLIGAHTPGTGKSYLVDLATAIVTGRPHCAVISAATNVEEAEKRLGALLREGITIAALDNCSNDLEGDVLCQLVERPLVRIRILGLSEAPEFENKSVVVATGNNIRPKGDLVRRTLTCNLVAEIERPELRRFESEPIARVLADRGAYLAACFVIIRAYQAAGSPDVCEQPIGSYGRWSTVVRAPLVWLKEADPIKSMEAAREEDAELRSIRELFALWQQHLQGDTAYSAFEVAEVAADKDLETNALKRPEFHDFLLQVAGDRGLVSTRRLGTWLGKIKGRIVDGMKLLVEPAKSGTNRARKFRLAEVRNDSTSSEATS
jgi:hypothetical protein